MGAEGLQHVEHTIITGSTLHVTMSEVPEVVTFREGPAGAYTADGASSQANGDVRQALNDLNHRLRYVLGEHEVPIDSEPVTRSPATGR